MVGSGIEHYLWNLNFIQSEAKKIDFLIIAPTGPYLNLFLNPAGQT